MPAFMYLSIAMILFSSVVAIVRGCSGFKKLKCFHITDKKSKFTYLLVSIIHMIFGIVVIVFFIILLVGLLIIFIMNGSYTNTSMGIKMLFGLSGLGYVMFAGLSAAVGFFSPLIIGGTGLALNGIQKQHLNLKPAVLFKIHIIFSFCAPVVFYLPIIIDSLNSK